MAGSSSSTNRARAPTVPRKGCRAACWRSRAAAKKAGTGIVWAVVPLDGDANMARGVQGIVLALDAQDVRRQLWTSEQSGARDRLGLFPKFNPPTVAGGKVFVATYGDKETPRVYGGNTRPQQFPARYYVAVYGLLPHPPHLKPIVNQSRADITVTSARGAWRRSR